jgi:hypothetical protein
MQQAQQQAQQEAQEEQQEQMAAAQGGGAPGGGPGGPPDDGSGGGLTADQAPGQAGLPPGGRKPTMAEMVSGFRGNASIPINQFDIRRAVPTGT